MFFNLKKYVQNFFLLHAGLILYRAKFRKLVTMCRTYWCHRHLIDKEVGESSSLADESLLTEKKAIGIRGLVIRL